MSNFGLLSNYHEKVPEKSHNHCQFIIPWNSPRGTKVFHSKKKSNKIQTCQQSQTIDSHTHTPKHVLYHPDRPECVVQQSEKKTFPPRSHRTKKNIPNPSPKATPKLLFNPSLGNCNPE